ncbi:MULTISPECIES: prephenate dehydratase domain-containing protein [Streptomyces]|uniref:Bacilysin biosynthesis protein BacA n=1 Tax=Streptomyces siderophoricus TaxID=2802281 RepID=A0ABS1MT86_9ACTN|nr:prephenate dehydratase domain-containing protein [Streptomyces sp. 9-7]MBL1090958.1 bacilysin biosynthesis protein BacA [Streptomyces sp. 9-7]
MSNNDRRLQVHTLGPTGTNCEAAAHYYLKQHNHKQSSVVLHDTLENAVDGVMANPADSLLLGCVVYPKLNEIVFRNLKSMSLQECFVMPTHRMVLAARDRSPVRTVLSHPAPVNLIEDRDYDIRLVTSNAAAALECSTGGADACITTSVAADANNLEILEDFGPVQMGFSIHVPHGTTL